MTKGERAGGAALRSCPSCPKLSPSCAGLFVLLESTSAALEGQGQDRCGEGSAGSGSSAEEQRGRGSWGGKWHRGASVGKGC